VTPLLGREQELKTAAEALTTPGCRLLTLVGPGGIGKTQLAMQLAREQARVFAHGASYVPLAQVPSTEFVVAAIGEVLHIGQPGQVDPKRHLLNELTNQEILLVLDNFEHLLDGATLITEILNHAPAVNILVTSRERLNLRDEWALEIEGLGTPSDDGNGLADYPAVELFVQRLRQVRLNDPVKTGEYAIIARICRLVEGMPLAIELAAAWAPTLPLGQIAREVERSVDFLATSMRDLPERHRSMAAVFNHSWHLLTTAEQQVFRRLSIFRGGFTLAAAEQITGAAADVVAALVSKSFVRRQTAGRYDIHELLRQFGERKLDEDPAEARGTGERHCEYFLEFIVQRGAMLIGRDQHRVLAEISMEIASVRAAARWATVHGKARELYRATQGLWLFYAARGWMREGERSFADVVTAFSAREQSGSSSQRDHTLALGMAYVGQGVCLNRLGSYEDGRDRLQAGIALLRPLDAKRELGLALNLLASAIRPTGDTGQERALLEESISLFQEMEDSWGCGYSLNDLGMVAHLQGDDKEAVDLCRESLMIFDQLGDLRGRAFAQGNLGVIATELGNLEDAAAKHEESLALRQSMGDEWGSADTLVHLAEVARLMNRNRHARGLLMEALRTAVDGEYQPVILDALIELATLLIPQGQSALAQETLTAVLAHPAVNHYTHTKAERMLARMDGLEPRHDMLSVSSNAWEAARMVQQLSRRYLADGAILSR
jgi:predicted ATPase